MYTLILGRLVHEAQSPAEFLLAAMTKQPATCLEIEPHLDPSVAALIDRALSCDKDRRFGTATEMRRELVRIRRAVSESERRGHSVAQQTRPAPGERENAEGVAARVSAPVVLPLRRPVALYSVLATVAILAGVGFAAANQEMDHMQALTNWGGQLFDLVAEEGNALAAQIVAEEIVVAPTPDLNACWTLMSALESERSTPGTKENYAGKPLPLAPQLDKRTAGAW
jgi:hypothetical protein